MTALLIALLLTGDADCAARLEKALQAVLNQIEDPNGVGSRLPIYQPPEVRLRQEADRIERERRERAEARRALKECGQ